jgi:hypothetical protein
LCFDNKFTVKLAFPSILGNPAPQTRLPLLETVFCFHSVIEYWGFQLNFSVNRSIANFTILKNKGAQLANLMFLTAGIFGSAILAKTKTFFCPFTKCLPE